MKAAEARIRIEYVFSCRILSLVDQGIRSLPLELQDSVAAFERMQKQFNAHGLGTIENIVSSPRNIPSASES